MRSRDQSQLFQVGLNVDLLRLLGKKRRLTFIECNNDINSMIDVAKVADLVLLMIDASFGFEMVIKYYKINQRKHLSFSMCFNRMDFQRLSVFYHIWTNSGTTSDSRHRKRYSSIDSGPRYIKEQSCFT